MASGEHRPLDIAADQGIEWRQNEQVYIARGNAHATRGNATIYADTLIAHYRPVSAPRDKTKGADPLASDSLGGSTEIYQFEADGHVRLVTETQNLVADHAVYDMDSATAVATGKALRLTTPQDVVTARDSLEWYDRKLVAVARGDALALRENRRLAGDVLVAQIVKPDNAPSRISRIDAHGHVVVTTLNEIARGASGVYNADTGIATLAGGVTITRGENQLRGQKAVVDLNKNVSRLLSDSGEGAGAVPGSPVQGLILPKQSKAAVPKTGAENTSSADPAAGAQ